MSNAIYVEDLQKSFRVREREPGLRGAVRGLFTAKVREVCAVDHLSFKVEVMSIRDASAEEMEHGHPHGPGGHGH